MGRACTLRIVAVLGALLSPAAAEDYEAPPVLAASRILPSPLLKSDVHEVHERVRTDGYLYQFVMESKFGLYRVDSLALLRVRVHEVRTLAKVIGMKQTDEFFNGLGTRLEQTADVPVKLLEDPAGTVEQVGKGVEKQLGRIGGFFKKRKKSKQEDPALNELLMGMEKRKLAAELDLDVYSTNPKVQEFLKTIAGARASGKLAVDLAAMAIPGGAGVAVGAAKFSGQVEDLLRDNSPAELYIHNEKKLKAMGVDSVLIGRFLNHRHLSPRHKTVLVASLEALDGVAGREVLLTAALDTDKESVALFHERRAALLVQYHAREPLQRIEARHDLPLVTTRKGDRLLLLPVDAAWWSEETATILRGLAEDGGRWSFVVTGRLTPRARKGAAALGYAVREGYGLEPGK
ncbi:MAG: hypothetical protein ACE5JG_02425 [Planctomycetota bacterium]